MPGLLTHAWETRKIKLSSAVPTGSHNPAGCSAQTGIAIHAHAFSAQISPWSTTALQGHWPFEIPPIFNGIERTLSLSLKLTFCVSFPVVIRSRYISSVNEVNNLSFLVSCAVGFSTAPLRNLTACGVGSCLSSSLCFNLHATVTYRVNDYTYCDVSRNDEAVMPDDMSMIPYNGGNLDVVL